MDISAKIPVTLNLDGESYEEVEYIVRANVSFDEAGNVLSGRDGIVTLDEVTVSRFNFSKVQTTVTFCGLLPNYDEQVQIMGAIDTFIINAKPTL